MFFLRKKEILSRLFVFEIVIFTIELVRVLGPNYMLMIDIINLRILACLYFVKFCIDLKLEKDVYLVCLT